MSLTPFFQPSNQTHTFLSNYRRLLLLAVLIIASLTWASAPAQAEGPTPQPPRHYRADEIPSGLTAAEWQQITGQLSEQRQYAPVAADQPGHLRAINPAQDWSLDFAPTGLTVQPAEGAWRWGLRLQAYGRAGAMQLVDRASLSAEGQSVTYHWNNNLRELYHNRPDGLKQDFVLERRPEGSGPLRLEVATPGNLTGQLANGGINFYDAQGRLILTYGGLHVYDATGQPIPAHFELENPEASAQSKIQNLP